MHVDLRNPWCPAAAGAVGDYGIMTHESGCLGKEPLHILHHYTSRAILDALDVGWQTSISPNTSSLVMSNTAFPTESIIAFPKDCNPLSPACWKRRLKTKVAPRQPRLPIAWQATPDGLPCAYACPWGPLYPQQWRQLPAAWALRLSPCGPAWPAPPAVSCGQALETVGRGQSSPRDFSDSRDLGEETEARSA